MLQSTKQSQAVARRALRGCRAKFPEHGRRLSADYEHGQW